MSWLPAASLRQRWHVGVLIALAVAFAASHLPFVSRSPVSVDAVNLALGVEDFDLADHRPHPPGYPIVIALGKLSRLVLDRVAPSAPPGDAVRALALWSTLFGALAPLAFFHFFRAVDGDVRAAVAATALTVTCPLFWFTAARPMSDVPGLVAGFTAQALLLAGWRRQQMPVVLVGGLAAGLSVGFRVQNAWLTLPLLVWVVLQCRPRARSLTRAAAMWLAGILIWALPLTFVVGGPAGYVDAFAAQGEEDLARADILVTNRTVDRLLVGLIHTFAYPWANTWSAAAILGLALVGAIAIRRLTRSARIALAVSTLPYALFHLVFQESVHVRYALPLVPAVAYLAVNGIHALVPRSMPFVVAALTVSGVAITFPAVASYGRTASPAYQALEDIRAHAKGKAKARVLAMHFGLSRLLRGEAMPARALPVAPEREWLALVEHWRTMPDVPVWFLAERGRRDLALLDRRSRRLIRSYGWSFPRKFAMGRMPANGVDWYELAPPGWIATEGWALSHESAGVAARDHGGPAVAPIKALVRRRKEEAVLMVGGRNLSFASGAAARIEVAIAGRAVATWDLPRESPFFLRMFRLPAGILTSPTAYVPLTVRAWPTAESGGQLAVAIEQFDVQSANTSLYGLDAGWYEPEYDGAAPAPWRWTAAAATARVHHGGHDLTLRVVGEVPLEQLARPPRIVVRAGARVLTEVTASTRDIVLEARVPAAALDEANGLLTLETDQTFVAHEAFGNGDYRRVGLRVYEFDLRESRR